MATWVSKFFGNRSEYSNNRTESPAADPYRLRALPNEDVYFFMKRIDNSKVVREADPQARAQSWKVLGAAGFAAIMLIAALLPSAYGLISGYHLHQLQLENQRLLNERATLQLEEAKLVNSERLQILADRQRLVAPAPSRVIYLTPKEGSLALNRQR